VKTAALTRRMARAARLYALANTFHSLSNADPGDDDIKWQVIQGAVDWSAKELAKLGCQPHDLLSLDDCINAAKRTTKVGTHTSPAVTRKPIVTGST